jgi:hypothetical protein
MAPAIDASRIVGVMSGRGVLSLFSPQPFHYAVLFAGYAHLCESRLWARLRRWSEIVGSTVKGDARLPTPAVSSINVANCKLRGGTVRHCALPLCGFLRSIRNSGRSSSWYRRCLVPDTPRSNWFVTA